MPSRVCCCVSVLSHWKWTGAICNYNRARDHMYGVLVVYYKLSHEMSSADRSSEHVGKDLHTVGHDESAHAYCKKPHAENPPIFGPVSVAFCFAHTYTHTPRHGKGDEWTMNALSLVCSADRLKTSVVICGFADFSVTSHNKMRACATLGVFRNILARYWPCRDLLRMLAVWLLLWRALMIEIEIYIWSHRWMAFERKFHSIEGRSTSTPK